MHHQEMSLLIIFDAIMTEGSVTQAAQRLDLTQPAVSNALARMRQAWGDELFLKDGRTIAPTLYAQNLWRQIKSPLDQLSQAVNMSEFDPATCQRTFRIAAADTIVEKVWSPLRKIIEQRAPNVRVHAVPYTIENADHLLYQAEVDLLIGCLDNNCDLIMSEFLYTPRYALLMRKHHPLLETELTLHAFSQADHLLVSLSGDANGPTDEALKQHNLTRNVAMTVNHFHAVPKLIKESNLICMVPTTTVEHSIFDDELVVIKAPVAIVSKSVNTYWHKRQDMDHGSIWLRNIINGIIKDQDTQHIIKLEQHLGKI
jgi:DNA-binding transcriptional LysR family regulator